MGKVCKDGLYDGRPANALEDAAACVQNGGSVVDSSTTGCAAIRIMQIPGVGQHSSLLTQLVVLPFRLVRSSLRDSPFVAAIDALAFNDELAADLERITSAHPAVADELTKVLLDAAYLVASVLPSDTEGSERGGAVFNPEFYERIAKVSRELEPHLTNTLHRHALNAAVHELQKLVGKKASDVYATLRKQPSEYRPKQ
jgi:hypothetical protein